MENNSQNLLLAGGNRQIAYEPAAYIMIDGKKRYIRTIGAFNKLTKERIKQHQPLKTTTGKEKISATLGDIIKEGNLLRGIIEREIYIIERGFKRYIYPGRFYKHYGKKVLTVDDEVLAQIPLLATGSVYEGDY